jgi:hypothetical protein
MKDHKVGGIWSGTAWTFGIDNNTEYTFGDTIKTNADGSKDVADIIAPATITEDETKFTNGESSGFKAWTRKVMAKINALFTNLASKYTKPSTGIPLGDLAPVPAQSILGTNGASPAVPAALSVAQVKAMLGNDTSIPISEPGTPPADRAAIWFKNGMLLMKNNTDDKWKVNMTAISTYIIFNDGNGEQNWSLEDSGLTGQQWMTALCGTTNIVLGGKTITRSWVRKVVLDIDLSLPNGYSIGDYFLSGCTGLTSIDLSGLSGVSSIGNYFLNDCVELTSLDLSGLSGVSSIGANFPNNCKKLTSLDLSGLSGVSSIGSGFLNDCSGLTSIDLSPLSNISSIGSNFLKGCFGLTSIDLSPLSNLSSIGNGFLYSCFGLTSIDLSPLSNISSIGNEFLRQCTHLTNNVYGWAVRMPQQIAAARVENTQFMLSVPTSAVVAVGTPVSDWTARFSERTFIAGSYV